MLREVLQHSTAEQREELPLVHRVNGLVGQVVKYQPIPQAPESCRNGAIGREENTASEGVAALRVTRGIREYCTWCAEMIFTHETACEAVIFHRARGWLSLCFHARCYMQWQPPARRCGEEAVTEMSNEGSTLVSG